ncbi:MAG: tetratricopeptide repeat protein, partial [Gallionella sp.]|nr:tetratricopeptide repeat protein [Gallionella sp.]
MEWSQKGEYSKAAETLLEFVSITPGSPLSTDYLMSAARIYERGGQYDKAVETWARVANEYPGTAQASNAVYLMGIIDYRQGDFTSALDSFHRSLGLSVAAEDQARAYLWIGKTQQKLGDNEAASNSWRTGQALDADGYYSERARDLLIEREPLTPPTSVNLGFNLSNGRADADTWMRITFGIGTDVDLNGLGPLSTDGRVT